MTLIDILRQAGHALTTHRLRTGLSALGIVIGVATVVAAFAIGEGARQAAHAEFAALGTRNVFLRAVEPAPSSDSRVAPPAPVLSTADAAVMRATIASLSAVATRRSTAVDATAGRHRTTVVLNGVTPAWREIATLKLIRGRWLREADLLDGRRVAVVSEGHVHALFGQADPLGATILIGDVWFRIVGIVAGRDEDVWVPLTTMDIRLGAGDSLAQVQEIALQPRDAEEVERVALAAGRVLQARHGDLREAWTVVVPRMLMEARLRSQRTSRVVLLGIGGLALLISGVGIMNIMLASVVERVHEIGVRRAFGARRREIVCQFAAEAAVLCVSGGLVGLPLGAALAWMVAAFGGWPVAITPMSAVLSLVLAGAVGLVFGVYPARIAASLDPAAALRSE